MSLTPAQELAALKAQRTALANARDARVAEAKVADEIAEQRRLLDLETALVDAEEKYGELNRKIAVVHVRRADGSIAGSVILKRPNHQIYRKYQLSDPKTERAKADEIDKLIAHCRVWPELESVESMLEEYAGSATSMLFAINKLAGFSAEDIAGK